MGETNTSAELVLGTAQLGMPYGAANRTGQPSEQEAKLILRSAVNAGVRWIDTAAAYGSSEQRIGAALPGSLRVRTATKLSPLDDIDERTTPGEIRWAVRDSVRRSCTRLKVDRLEVLMLHRAAHLTAFDGAIWHAVKAFRDEGAIYDLGVSVYAPEEALQAIADRDVRHIQLPFNALDWRWRESGVIEALAKRPNVTVHARSALLQGLLAAGPDAHWPDLEGVDASEMHARLVRTARDLGRDSIADLCLAYVRAQSWIDGVVVGMESLQQLALNLALFKRPPLTQDEVAAVDASLPRATERLLNPALWAKAA
ncbi:MAG: aldo/keto reductase [Alphaproteobacteria bacterium]|nr:aldo/keto reductase [Alphaproteobacteria bacterium]